LRNAVAIAEAGRKGEVRYLGEVDTGEAATRTLIAKLAAKYGKLTFCYEAGPTGYGLYRLIESLGHTCIVAAPSLIPKKAGERVKTNRRDAVGLARLLRAGELTAVWVPDGRHEAMRELTRARDGDTSVPEIGGILVLHTWGQTLTHLRDVHCVVPGGGWRLSVIATSPPGTGSFLLSAWCCA
jgi:hypothetical protein